MMSPQRLSVGLRCVLTSVFLLSLSSSRLNAGGLTGEQIYRKQCAGCHGLSGEGSKDNERPLAGEKSVAQLAKLIARTMPKEDPGTCVGADADTVAAYIHGAFYSREARERNKPPRIELARLTVAQYRNAVADLIGSFRTPIKWDDKRGLHVEYFNARDFRRDKRVIDRTDPEVRFDFGTFGPVTENFGARGPEPEKFDPYQFSMRWEGSVIAPETGNYEFIVNTDHATRLWINDNRQPLIDAWVKSGSDTEHRASIFLLAGRAYPLRLEFSKAKQGVDDSKENAKRPPGKASIALLWKLPNRSAEVIPARALSPNRFPETFVLETAFPPDDRSFGWERATTVSKEWDAATTEAALDTTVYLMAHLAELSGERDDAGDRATKLRDFCRRFAERAFRRPLSDDQKRIFIDRQFEAVKDTDTAVKRVLLFVLKSPRFLYREVGGGPDAFDVADRLSFILWDSSPDKELLDAAAAGKLSTKDQVRQQAERMLADPRAKAKLHEFLLIWAKIKPVADVAKDQQRFPGFDTAIASDLRTSLDLFLDEVLASESADFRRLLLADDVYLNGRLAKFYSVDLAADAPFQKVKLNADQRSGVLTHPYVMASLAYTASTSPIHRGVFLARGVLGVSLQPPPEAVAPLAADLHPKLTTRERVLLQTKPATCQGCHGIVNPLGFTLENFDAVGRFRDKDNDQPVDTSGSYQTRTGETLTFKGVHDLAKFLVGSEEVHTAFTEQLFHHLVKQSVRAYGPRQLADLRSSFTAKDFNIRQLAVEIATVASLPAPKKKE